MERNLSNSSRSSSTSDGYTRININDNDRSWARTTREQLNALQHMKMSCNSFTICRVPLHIRQGKEKYYDPVMVSIGPYHRGREHLQAMEPYKLQYLNDFLQRNTQNTLEEYISILREVEGRVRKCYFDHIDLTSEEFVTMLLFDGCFIIELFLKNSQRELDGNEIRDVEWFLGRVMIDLLLLENQIPAFLLCILFDYLVSSSRPRDEEERSIYDLGIIQIICRNFTTDTTGVLRGDDIHHILAILYGIIGLRNADHHHDEDDDDIAVESNIKSPILSSFVKLGVELSNLLKPIRLALLRTYRRPSSERKGTSSKKATKIPCASKLIEYGIKFESKYDRSSKPTNISYKDGVLEIPQTTINEQKKHLMFNLLAFEQCNLTSIQELSSYFRFMDFLIDTPKDVEILEECGVIVSYLKSTEDTAVYYNQLNDYGDIDDKDNSLLPVCEEINKFCDSKWHRYRAKLKRDYFSSPWTILSLIAAVILLILTLVQTFFAVYGYFKPPS